jgi:RNA recognition motif-containing protein
MDLSAIFSKAPPQLKNQPTAEEIAVEAEPEQPTLHQNDLRNRRTVFVGNVSLDTPKKALEKIFGKHGKVEAAWERSVPVETESKAPVKAKVIQKKFVDGATNKSCYILFATEEEAEAAVEAEKKLAVDGRHLQVSLAIKKDKDFKTTVFVGNVDFKIDEEKIRHFFGKFGEVEGVRMVRDPMTHQPKGFCFVRFTNKEGYLKALQDNGCELAGRSLRIGKAVKTPQPYYDFQNKSKEGVAKAIKKLRHDKPGSRKDRRAKVRAEKETGN